MADVSDILERKPYEDDIVRFLNTFYNSNEPLTTQKGLYVCGPPGIGKTRFVCDTIKKNNFDVIYYNSTHVRNRNLIDMLTQNNMATTNVYSMMIKETKKLVVVLDDLENMNSGDKTTLNSLIKIIRVKKTKKQANESSSSTPIVCIGNIMPDKDYKKINEIANVCRVIRLNTPTDKHIRKLLEVNKIPPLLNDTLVRLASGNLRKLYMLMSILNTVSDDKTLHTLIYTNDTDGTNIKNITQTLFNKKHDLDVLKYVNDADRTTVSLLYHENMIDYINKSQLNDLAAYKLYGDVLSNICYGDYIDRITFQKQIWNFNEMSFLIKVLMNKNICENCNISKTNLNTIRFTKILTKYSTEYVNTVFLNTMCQTLGMDRKDLESFTQENKDTMHDYEYEITKLEQQRLIKYFCKESTSSVSDSEIEPESDIGIGLLPKTVDESESES